MAQNELGLQIPRPEDLVDGPECVELGLQIPRHEVLVDGPE